MAVLLILLLACNLLRRANEDFIEGNSFLSSDVGDCFMLAEGFAINVKIYLGLPFWPSFAFSSFGSGSRWKSPMYLSVLKIFKKSFRVTDSSSSSWFKNFGSNVLINCPTNVLSGAKPSEIKGSAISSISRIPDPSSSQE